MLQLRAGMSLSLSPTKAKGQARPTGLQLARRAFAHQGYLLATHQVGALIFCCIVICSLLAPALLLYFAPDGPTSAIARRGRGELLWELEGMKSQGIIWSEEEVCWDRLATYYESRGTGHRARVVRMEQILVASPSSKAGAGALGKRTLHHALQLQSELERRLLADSVAGLTCVRDSAGRCAIASPASWWSDERALLADADVHATLSLPSPYSAASNHSLPLTTTNTLVGVGRDLRGTVKGAQFLAITFFLEDTSADMVLKGIGSMTEESARERSKAAWRKAVKDVVAGVGWPSAGAEQMGKTRETRGTGRRIILKHLPHLPVHANPRLFEDVLFAIGYGIVALYVFSKTKGTNQVHSKLGLTLTGFVELLLNGIMSLSICWLMSLPIGLVPWKLIPFLVLVCGIDNMFVLTAAISGTDINLAVPERVAAGLASVGLSTTLTLLAELVLATVLLRLISVQVIRELITFACVALVVDYFMGVYFFTTILSIDIERLELADLLSQGSKAHAPPSPSITSTSETSSPAPSEKISSLFAAVLTSVRARAARTTTFSFLFFINILLYSLYGVDHYLPAFCSETALAKERPLLSPSLSTEFAGNVLGYRGGRDIDIPASAGEAFWSLINPGNASSVHVYVEPVTVVKFHDDGLAAPESAGGHAVPSQSLAFTGLLLLLPIAVTTFFLYLILLYLLKDADLLAARRTSNRAPKAEKKGKTDAGVDLAALRGRHASDVQVLASSQDLVASWAGLDDRVVIWRRTPDATSPSTFEASHLHIPITAEPASLTLIALDGAGEFCAAATMTGRILAWSLERRLLIDFSLPPGTSLRLATHLFASPVPGKGATPAPPGGSTRLPDRHGFFSAHQDGSLILWDCIGCRASIVLPPSLPSPDVKMRNVVLLAPVPSTWPLYARVYSTGRLEVFRTRGGDTWDAWAPVFDQLATTAADPITALAFGTFSLGGTGTGSRPRTVLVTGTLGGLVSLFDLDDGARLSTLTEMAGAVRQVRLSVAVKTKCPSCAEPLSDGFFVTASTRQVLTVLRVCAPGCNCTTAPLWRSPSSLSLARSASSGSFRTPRKQGRRSSHARSITGSSGGGTPAPDDSPYPSPSHGFHLRRASAASPEKSRRIESADPNATLLVPDVLGVEAELGLVPIEPNGSSHEPEPEPTEESSLVPFEPVAKIVLSTPATDESTSRDSSLSSSVVGDVPLFEIEATPERSSPRPSFDPDGPFGDYADWLDLHVQEVTSTVTDERGGWEVVGQRIVGVRRRRATQEEKDARSGPGQTAWEVWSMVTNSTGMEEGSTSLDRLLAQAVDRPSQNDSTSASAPPTSSDTLRRRQVTPISGSSESSSPVRTRPRATSSAPTIRFEEVDLPFSRARPVITALGGEAIAVGLGNSVGVITPKGAPTLKGLRTAPRRSIG
ncbi:hypothetical protein RQP46_000598 [Phenoliferia psychrophenolica]